MTTEGPQQQYTVPTLDIILREPFWWCYPFRTPRFIKGPLPKRLRDASCSGPFGCYQMSAQYNPKVRYVYIYSHFGVDIMLRARFRKLSRVVDSDSPGIFKLYGVRQFSLAEAIFSLKPFGSYLLGNDYTTTRLRLYSFIVISEQIASERFQTVDSFCDEKTNLTMSSSSNGMQYCRHIDSFRIMGGGKLSTRK